MIRTQYEADTAAIRALLSRVRDSTGLDLELHPAWSPVILDQRSVNLGFKVHQRQGQTDRIMSLILHPFVFERLSDGTKQLKSSAENQIVREFQAFWSEGNEAEHTVVEVLL